MICRLPRSTLFLYQQLLRSLAKYVDRDRDEFEDIAKDLDATMTDRYFCNFSVFQSLPDAWAIDQLFPRSEEHTSELQSQSNIVCRLLLEIITMSSTKIPSGT